MDIYQLINNWHQKAYGTDCFSAFVFEYLAFIAFLRKIKFNYLTGCDRTIIQNLKRETNIKRNYLKKIEDMPNLRDAWKKIIDELNSLPLGNVSRNIAEVEELKWWSCSLDEPEAQKEIRNDVTTGTIHGIKDWENMVEFWYSIRNNLFHGGKNPNDPRDQLLADNGYKTLHPLVELLLSSDL